MVPPEIRNRPEFQQNPVTENYSHDDILQKVRQRKHTLAQAIKIAEEHRQLKEQSQQWEACGKELIAREDFLREQVFKAEHEQKQSDYLLAQAMAKQKLQKSG